MSFIKKYLVALFVVFLHFAGAVRYLTLKSNRYYFLWDRHHAVALLADLFLISLAFALLALGGAWLARRFRLRWLERLLGHMLLVALLSGLLAAFPSFSRYNHPTLTKTIWLGAMAVIGYSLAHPRSRLVRYAANFCLLFSPVTFIVSAQVLSWQSWHDPPRTDFAVRNAAGPRAPVFLFVFDEWSRARSMTGGEFRSFFKNVRRLCEQAIVFREARSPGDDTEYSLPRLIYQCDSSFVVRDGQTYWKEQDKEVLTRNVPSLFQLAREQGYNAYMVGWFLPYRRILGDQVDYCRVYRGYRQGDGVPAEMVCALFRSMRFWTDPVSQRVWKLLYPRARAEHFRRVNTRIRQEMLDILNDCPTNTFALFHVPLPHDPYIWDADGAYRGPSKEAPSVGYERNLKYLDVYIGQVLEQLRATGKFDDALIIITSDHSWRKDSEPTMREGQQWQRKVPLIIKLPGQRSGCVIEEEFCTNRLKPLFEAVFAGERDTRRLLDLVRHTLAANRAAAARGAAN